MSSELDRLCINTIRMLAIDAIQKAKSGHPGTPMGMAPVAYCLWQKELNFDPADPLWPNRDHLTSRVVSMPSWELFELQSGAYRESVLPDAIEARVAVEQAAAVGWERYVGRRGAVVGMHTFGASAPLKGLLTKFGFMPEHVVEVARAQVAKHAH
jgi:transketolase